MNKKIFMLQKLMRDLTSNPPTPFVELDKKLSYYYLKFEHHPKKLNRLITDFDEKGVPINAPYIDVENGKPHYYPISIGQYGLAVFHAWLESGKEKDRQIFLNIADWFIDNKIEDPKTGAYWLTEIPKPEFNVYDSWKSAFVQSRALSILLRAWQITDNKQYLVTASKALLPFKLSTEEGGVSADLDGSMAFYEEYVASKPTRILDGGIFALFGVYDYMRATEGVEEFQLDNQLAKEIFTKGIEGLKYWLPKFDMGYWVYYNRCEIENYPQNDPCTIGYLKLVSTQLFIIWKITNSKIFMDYHLKFKKYLSNPLNILKMYKEKFKALKNLNRI